MLRCSEEAFARCQSRHLCGCREHATYMEGSECDRFNQYAERLPMTNSDRIRAMTDKELAEFLAAKFADQETLEAIEKGSPLTATYISMLHHTWYVTWMQWLRSPVQEESICGNLK